MAKEGDVLSYEVTPGASGFEIKLKKIGPKAAEERYNSTLTEIYYVTDPSDLIIWFQTELEIPEP